MSNKTNDPQLWTPRSVEETQSIYRDWAGTYENDVAGYGYATPDRCADALAQFCPADTALLDFGCGTGLAAQAVRSRGFTTIDGTDISSEMMEGARAKGLYRKLWVGEPGQLPVTPGTYGAILAVGVVSLGAAPPETLELLLAALAPQGLLVFSYNDPTLGDPNYTGLLDTLLANGVAMQIFREHGAHLPAKDMGSDVFVLAKS